MKIRCFGSTTGYLLHCRQHHSLLHWWVLSRVPRSFGHGECPRLRAAYSKLGRPEHVNHLLIGQVSTGKDRLRKDQPRKLMKMMMQPTMTSCKGKGKGKGKSKGRLRKDQPRKLMKMMMQPTMTSQITSATMNLTNHHQLTKQDILLLLHIHNSNIVTYHFISASKFLHIKSVQ